WSSLVLSYCTFHRIYKIPASPTAPATAPLFANARINKRLEEGEVREVLEYMRKEGRAEQVGGGNGVEWWVWWRTPEEWAGRIYEWIDETAQKNTVLTLYELTESEATLSQEFHGMDPDLLQRVMGILVKRGKAQVFGQDDGQGVKFF
ncbi:Vacuolar protein-sorting-associated protein, partial [Lachnellula suecica]